MTERVTYDGFSEASCSIVPLVVESMGPLPTSTDSEWCIDYQGEQYRGSGENWVNIRTLEDVELVDFIVRPSEVRESK